MKPVFLVCTLSALLATLSCGKKPSSSDKLPEATIEGTLSRNGSPFEGIIHLTETNRGSENDAVTIYARAGCIRREVRIKEEGAPVIGMIYKAEDTLVTIYGISTKTNTRSHYQMTVAAFNEEKENGFLYVHPTNNSSYSYIRPYSYVFDGVKDAGSIKDSIYNGSMGRISLKANYYDTHGFTYCRAIWSPEITIDTSLVRMTERYMPADLPTLALYVNYYNIPENAADKTLDKLLKKSNKLLAKEEQVVLNGVDAHKLTDADFLPPTGSKAVATEAEFSIHIGNYRESTKAKTSTDNGHHHHHHH